VETQTSDTVTATSTASPSTYAVAEVGVTVNSPPPTNPPVPNSFFSMSASSGIAFNEPWPSVASGGFRLWDTTTGWDQLNPSAGVYSWTMLDRWLAKLQSNHADAIYTFGRVPQWASSNPNDTSCRFGPGACDPPNDLNADGSGANQHWKDFVTAIVKHSAGKIQYWEMWNEPQNRFFCNGTFTQMERMTRDARDIIKSIDANAAILSPGTGLERGAARFTSNYLAAGAGPFLDIIAFHGYIQGSCPNTPPDTSALGPKISDFRAMLLSHGADGKPLWDTEASWGRTKETCFTDPDLQAAFVAQAHLLHWSNQIARFYWYQWDNPSWGALWSRSTGTILPAGIAYQQLYQWLVGASLVAPCTASGTLWSCSFTRPAGYQGLVLWDTSQSCNNGSCSAVNVPVDASYTRYRDLAGKVTPISGQIVPVGTKPILIENQ